MTFAVPGVFVTTRLSGQDALKSLNKQWTKVPKLWTKLFTGKKPTTWLQYPCYHKGNKHYSDRRNVVQKIKFYTFAKKNCLWNEINYKYWSKYNKELSSNSTWICQVKNSFKIENENFTLPEILLEEIARFDKHEPSQLKWHVFVHTEEMTSHRSTKSSLYLVAT